MVILLQHHWSAAAFECIKEHSNLVIGKSNLYFFEWKESYGLDSLFLRSSLMNIISTSTEYIGMFQS